MNNFEIKKRIIESGESSVLKEWQRYSSISKEDFLEAVEWVCQDPFDARGRITRKIGLEQDRIVKLDVVHFSVGITAFYNMEDHFIWSGASFRIPPETEWEKKFTRADGMLWQIYKISLCARDRV